MTCALTAITTLPSKAAADVVAFNSDGSVQTASWTFHGARPAWAGIESAIVATVPTENASKRFTTSPAGILTLIAETALRHQGNRALAELGITPNDWRFLFQAMIEAESRYNPSAVSPKGALGLGQLMPDTARSLGVDPRDMQQNLDGAARYFLAQLAAFKDVDLALAAYNAGPQRVIEFGEVPPFSETRTYIARIHRIRARLSGGSEPAPTTRVADVAPARAPVLIDLN